MCHRLCGLSAYRLKAHVREMSTPPKLTFGHGTSLPYVYRFTDCQEICLILQIIIIFITKTYKVPLTGAQRRRTIQCR